jgi:hypothetical protein
VEVNRVLRSAEERPRRKMGYLSRRCPLQVNFASASGLAPEHVRLPARSERSSSTTLPSPALSKLRQRRTWIHSGGSDVRTGIVRFDNGAYVRVAVAETREEMARGLMDRTSLPENEGMLFWMARGSTTGSG